MMMLLAFRVEREQTFAADQQLSRAERICGGFQLCQMSRSCQILCRLLAGVSMGLEKVRSPLVEPFHSFLRR